MTIQGTVELHPQYGIRGKQSGTPKAIRLVEVHGEDAARDQMGQYLSGQHLALDAEGEVARKLQASGYIIPNESSMRRETVEDMEDPSTDQRRGLV
jgi:hypothetical protein